MATVPHHARTTRYQKCEAGLSDNQSRSALSSAPLMIGGGAIAASLILRALGQKNLAQLTAQLAPLGLLVAIWKHADGSATADAQRVDR